MAGDLTIEILRDIRDELRGVRAEVHALRTETSHRIEAMSQRLDLLETTLLDLAGQNRLIVRYTKVTSEREWRVEPRGSLPAGSGGEPSAE